MTLKAIVDNLDGVDASYHDLYDEKDGKFFLKPIEGLKPEKEFTVVHNALTKERTDHKESKKKLQAFGDLNPEEVRTQLDRIPELEAASAGNLDENKINGLVETRIKGRLAPVERARDLALQQVGDLSKTVEGLQQQDRNRKIGDAVMAEARKSKVVESALPDVSMLAERIFELGEDGRVQTRDGVGVTPGLDPAAWLTDARNTRPHWWPGSAGGGAREGAGGTGSTNPWRKENWNLTEQAKLQRDNPKRAESLARAAGSSLGAMHPPK